MSNTLPDSIRTRADAEQAAWRAVHRIAVELYEASSGIARIGGDTPFDGVITTVWIDMLRLHGEAPDLGATASLSTAIPDSPAWARQRKPIRAKVRMAVYRRDGYVCLQCGRDDELTIDHVIPWSRGGSDHPDNLQTLCWSCNQAKGAR